MTVQTLERQAESLLALTRSLDLKVQERTASLESHEIRLRAIIDTAVDGIIVINTWSVIESVNPAATTLFGLPDKTHPSITALRMPQSRPCEFVRRRALGRSNRRTHYHPSQPVGSSRSVPATHPRGRRQPDQPESRREDD